MIRIASQPKPAAPEWHELFLRMLPGITRYVRIAFRHLAPEAKAEAIQEAICNAFAAVARLAELGKLDLAFPTVLGRYAVAQVRDGRKVGCKLNVRDVLSRYCQARKNVVVERLDKYDANEDSWQEIIIEDRHAGPAETARVRMDFGDWLHSLPRRDRRIALKLASGEQTSRVAQVFQRSEGRISQLRKELKAAWDEFTGEAEPPQAAMPA